MKNNNEINGVTNLKIGMFFVILGIITTYIGITSDDAFLPAGISVLVFSVITTIYLYINIKKTNTKKIDNKDDIKIPSINLVQKPYLSEEGYQRYEYKYEIKGPSVIWVVAILFSLIGGTFTTIGFLEEEIFILIGTPFLLIGIGILIAAIYSLKLKSTDINKYKRFLWYISFSGGLFGYSLMAIGSLVLLPIFIFLGLTDSDSLLIGGIFSGVGLILTLLIIPLVKWQLKDRPWLKKDYNKMDIK